MNFDPNTGEPLQNDNLVNNNNVSVPENNITVDNISTQPTVGISQPIPEQPTQPEVLEPVQANNDISQAAETESTEEVNMQDSVKGIPTVEQNNQSFVANTQAISSEKKSDEKPKGNYALILILLAVLVVAVFFGFPLLQKLFR